MDKTSLPRADHFKVADFSKDVLVYSFGSGLLLIFGFIQSFIIPKYLSIESYGYWQTFTLYGSYAGLLHIGFADGLLVRFAGKDLDQIGEEISIAFRFILLQQIIIIIPLAVIFHFVIAPPLHDIWLLLLAYAFVMNLFTFFTFIAQSIRKFRPLTIINTARGAVFLVLVLFIFLQSLLSYTLVIACFVVSFLICLGLFIYWFRHYLWKNSGSFSQLWRYGVANIDTGIYILFGNFIVVLFLTIDRLMVNSFFSIEQFAFYAFSLAIVMIAFTFIKAVSEVFFPHVSRSESNRRTQIYHTGRIIIILSGALALILYYPLAQLIEYYLPQYMQSLIIIKILVCTIGFSSIIQVLHINYYKVFGKQREYFLWGITALAIAVVLNLAAIRIWNTLSVVAAATLFSFLIWYIMNELSLKRALEITNKDMIKGILLFVFYLGAFWLSMLANYLWWQFAIYAGLLLIITGLLLRKETMAIAADMMKFLKNKAAS